MESKNRLKVWLPFIIAASISAGIYVGNKYDTMNKGITQYLNQGKIGAILGIISSEYVDSLDYNQLVETTIPKIFNELDPHSVYIPAKDLAKVNEELDGSFSGIGVSFNMQTDTIMVINVIQGGPAEKAGVLPFDRIITINDSLFAGVKSNQEEIMKNLRGMKNSVVKLGIKRGLSDKLIDINVTRGDVPVKSVDVFYEIEKGIGYIKISKFGRNTYNEFLTAIAGLKQQSVNSFIIDLRDNTGGFMDAATQMINEFMPEGSLIVYAEGKAFPRQDILSDGTGTCKESPLIVLTDENSASASEIFAGAIQDNDRGYIVGRRTFGKGLVQNQIPLNDGSAFRLTVARYYTPSGRCIQKQYKKGDDKDYDMDIYNRFLHGEFDSADSIKVVDSLAYKTLSGRTVYGGGGIMPDYFIPRDTSGITSYFSNIVTTGVLYLYALRYSDRNHEKLASFSTYNELYDYLGTQPLLYDFTNFAATQGVKKRPTLINISANLITLQLKAYIIRNFFDDEGFYPIFLKDDVTIQKAIQLFKEGKVSPSLSVAQTS